MMAAVEEAYKNQKMVGRFPGCVIHLTVRPNEVDVNVHPAKTEVKFQNEQQVFSTVYHAVLSALGADRSRPQAVLPGVRGDDTVTPNQTVLTMRDDTGALLDRRSPERDHRPVAGAGLRQPSQSPAGGFQFRRVDPLVQVPASPVSEPRPVSEGGEELPRERPAPAEPVAGPEDYGTEQVSEPAAPAKPVEPEKPAEPARPAAPVQGEEPPRPEPERQPQEEPWQIRGELFRTYVMVEQGDKVVLIDKHAAHERVNFDRLKAADYQPMVQQLLVPATFIPAPEERETLLEQLPPALPVRL